MVDKYLGEKVRFAAISLVLREEGRIFGRGVGKDAADEWSVGRERSQSRRSIT